MRILFVAALALAALVGGSGREVAAQWCAQYDDYTYTCGFTSFGQCLDTVRGAGGACRPDRMATRPRAADPPTQPARPRRECQSLADRNC